MPQVRRVLPGHVLLRWLPNLRHQVLHLLGLPVHVPDHQRGGRHVLRGRDTAGAQEEHPGWGGGTQLGGWLIPS